MIKMYLLPLLTLTALCCAACAKNPRLIFSNDDGLGSLNLYQFYNTLTSSGTFDFLVSAPCDDKSGTGSRDTSSPEGDLRTASQGECRFNSTHGAPGHRHGHGGIIKPDGPEDARIYWVNGYPATSMRLGIDNFSSEAFSHLGSSDDLKKPELALTGINVGLNGDSTVSISGTVGAARFAAASRGIPAIAFSGAFGRAVGWNDPDLLGLGGPGKNADALAVSKTYAELATSLVLQIIKGAGQSGGSSSTTSKGNYLPKGTLLNVNFPDASSSSTGCNNNATSSNLKFRWVLAYTKLTNSTGAPDVRQGTCSRIPSEGEVLTKQNQKKCLISVSLVNALDLGVASVKDYGLVLESLKGWGASWACL